VSLFGSAVVGFSVIWFIALDTGSGWRFALLSVVAILPQGLMSMVGGVWADRFNRKALVIIADAAIAIVTLVLAVVIIIADDVSLLMIGFMLLVRGVAAGVQTPAAAAILPQLTPAEKLLRVNSVFGAAQSAIFIAAPALAGLLLAVANLGWILMIDVVTAAIAIAILAVLRIPDLPAADLPAATDTPATDTPAKPSGGIGEAVAFIRSHPGLRRATAGAIALMVLIIPIGQMAPIVVVKLWGQQPWMLSALEIAYSGGMIAGGAILAAWGGLSNRMTMMLIGGGIWAALTILQGVMPWALAYIVSWFPFGLAGPLVTTTFLTVTQELAPPRLLGRLMGVVQLVMALAGPLGLLILAPMADVFSPRWLLLGAGAATLIALALLARKAPALPSPKPRPRAPR
jgi:DHA3 family macrolide efflux protein-like MFS transporter